MSKASFQLSTGHVQFIAGQSSGTRKHRHILTTWSFGRPAAL